MEVANLSEFIETYYMYLLIHATLWSASATGAIVL